MFTFEGGAALMPTAVRTAFLLVGTVAVMGAHLHTQLLWDFIPFPARTHSWLFFGNISVRYIRL